MKRAFVVLGMGMSLLVGCKAATATVPPAALAAGAVNQTDEQINAALQAGHAVVVTAQADIAAGKFVPSAGYKTALNGLVAALNQADPIYQSYHAALLADSSTAVPAALVSIAGTITADIAALTAVGK